MVRPGQHISVDDAVLKQKDRDLHGTVLWIGDLPQKFKTTSKSALKAQTAAAIGEDAMTLEEARAYLALLDRGSIIGLCGSLTPALDPAEFLPTEVISARLSRALFLASRIPDPAAFFWLRRWVKVGDTFVEKA